MKRNCCLLRLPIALLPLFLFFIACKKGHPTDPDQPAKGSLQDLKGNCLPGATHGSWIAGLTPNADSCYVDVTVQVTAPGSYLIVSDSSNGVQFSDSGVFTQTGSQTIRLKPRGLFTTASPTSFQISFDNSHCAFYVPVDSLPAITSNRWRFIANGTLYQGNVDPHVWFLPNNFGTILEFNEEVYNSPDTLLVIELFIPADVDYSTGTYTATRFYVSDSSGIIIDGMPASDDRAKIIVTLKGAIWPPPENTRQIIGIFDGTAVDPRTNEVIPIKNGEFHMGA